MDGFVTKVRVNKSAESIFRLYLDETIMPQWISGFKGIEILRGEPRATDSFYRMLLEHNGENLQLYQKLLKVYPHEKLLVQMEHPEFITYSEILFKQAGEVTELSCKVRIEGKNLKVKLALPFVKSILEERNRQDYLVFKQVVERNA